ncbi:MAG: P1 family peptidase [Candidatus Nanopelagicales bacterium]|nr:P1 family peptidase [Candidatus Nanopelagicales bacterium]
MTTAADLGLAIGSLPAGPSNSVLDVAGVGLGHATVVRDEPAPPHGRGVARTGVSVLDPGGDLWGRPVAAGGAVLNGAGEMTGWHAAREWGLVETPIYLTSTMQLGRVYDAACRIALAEQPAVAEEVVIPVVGECDDSWLSWAGSMQVEHADVVAARRAARDSVGTTARPATGAVGAGTGMLCLGWKGGIGTASRVVGGHVVAVLLLTNFGQWDRLTVAGVPVGRILGHGGLSEQAGVAAPEVGAGGPPPSGSCIGIVVTDAPVDGAGCARLARRVGLGLARTGSTAHHGSGELFLGVSVGMRAARGTQPAGPALGGRDLDPLFEAVVDATEESVLDALLHATDTVGQRGRTALALPHDALREALAAPRA